MSHLLLSCDLSYKEILHHNSGSKSTKVFKTFIRPSRFKRMARGALAEDGAYSRAVLKRFLFHHVSSLKDKHFLDTLLPRVRRNEPYSLQFQHEVFESKTAVLHGYKVGRGDVCLGAIPCVLKSCLKIRHCILFLAEVLELQQDAGLWSVWKSSGRDGILAAHAVGPSPTWWSWDGDIVTCLV